MGQGLGTITSELGAARTRLSLADVALVDADAVLKEVQTRQADAKGAYDKALQAAGGDTAAATVGDAKVLLDKQSGALAAAVLARSKAAAQRAQESDEVSSLIKLREQGAILATSAAQTAAFARSARTHSALTPDAVAASVRGIVETIVKQDYSRESCLDVILSRHARRLDSSQSTTSGYYKVAVHYCMMMIGSEKSGFDMAESRRQLLEALNAVEAMPTESVNKPKTGQAK